MDSSVFSGLTSSKAFFSWVSSHTLIWSPFPPMYRPLSPELHITRWHGTIRGIWKIDGGKDIRQMWKITQSNKSLQEAHRVSSHGSSNCSYSFWISRHLSKLLICDSFTELHLLKQCPQYFCSKGIWKVRKTLKSLYTAFLQNCGTNHCAEVDGERQVEEENWQTLGGWSNTEASQHSAVIQSLFLTAH